MARRKGRRSKSGKWDHAVSPLQRARHDHRWHQDEACEAIQRVCPGHSGRPCRLDPSKLSEYENLKSPPSLVHIRAMCEVYQRSAEELGLITWRRKPESAEASGQPRGSRDSPTEATQTTDAYADVDPEPHPEVDDAMRRSTFVRGAASVTGAFLTDPIVAITRSVQESLSATRVSNRELETLSQAAQHYARGYYELAGPGRAEALMTDWATAAQLMQTTKTQTQARELSDTFARLSGILGSYVHEQGDNRRALMLFRTGLEAALESGNNDLAAWMCERHSRSYLYEDDDPSAWLHVARRGLDISGSARTTITARLHGRAAKGYALMGDRQAVEASLGAAEDTLAAASPGCWPSDDMPHGFTYLPELIDGDSALCYVELGDYERAKPAAERELAVQIKHTGTRAKSSAVPMNRLNLAICHLFLSEPVEACYVAMVALEQYTGMSQTKVRRRAHRFQRDLVGTYPDLKVTQEFTEFLETLKPRRS